MADRSAGVDVNDVLQGLAVLDGLRNNIARAMGVAMGQTVRDEAKERAPVLKAGNEGIDNQRAGQLRDAIYLAFDGRRSILNDGYLVYGVSWNAAKAPHGHLLEFGHIMNYQAVKGKNGFFTPLLGTARDKSGRKRGVGMPRADGPLEVAAEPFLGPAFDAKVSKLAAIAGAAGAETLQTAMSAQS